MSQPPHSHQGAIPATEAKPDKAVRDRAPYPQLPFDLTRALPPLWKKANNKHFTATEQHKKMLELLIWVAGKHGFKVKQRFPIQYWQNHVKKDGKIDLQLLDANGLPALLIEMDWTRNESSLHKLQAASILKIPVLWVSGVFYDTKEEARQLRVFADGVMGKPTRWWLPLIHLEHGWL
jgi:hypothetical protein